MIRILLVLLITLLSFCSHAQVQLKGKVIAIYKKEIMADGSHKMYDAIFYPQYTFFHLNDNYFTVYNLERGQKYILSDKDVTTIDSSLVVSYIGKRKNELKLIAVKEIYAPNHLLIAVIPYLDGKTKYLEYLVKVSSTSK